MHTTSMWGNPFFPVAKFGRNECAGLFRHAHLLQLSLRSHLMDLGGRQALCHCNIDERYHGDKSMEVFRLHQARLDHTMSCKPPLHGYPHVRVPDGGGRHSTANWRCPPSDVTDVFKHARTSLLRIVAEAELHKRLVAHVENPALDSFIPADTILKARAVLFEDLHLDPDQASEVATHQPSLLHLFQAMLHTSQDPDVNLIGTLHQAVPTGAIGSIPYSGVFHYRDP